MKDAGEEVRVVGIEDKKRGDHDQHPAGHSARCFHHEKNRDRTEDDLVLRELADLVHDLGVENDQITAGRKAEERQNRVVKGDFLLRGFSSDRHGKKGRGEHQDQNHAQVLFLEHRHAEVRGDIEVKKKGRRPESTRGECAEASAWQEAQVCESDLFPLSIPMSYSGAPLATGWRRQKITVCTRQRHDLRHCPISFA